MTISIYAQLLHRLQQTSEGNKSRSPFLKSLLPEARCKLTKVPQVIFFGCRMKLKYKSRAFRIILVKQAKCLVPAEKASEHDLRNMHFLLPLHPFFYDGVIYFDGDIVNEH